MPNINVDAEALRQMLVALNGPGHYIRELQVTRGPLFENPIDKLAAQYNEWVASQGVSTQTARALTDGQRRSLQAAIRWAEAAGHEPIVADLKSLIVAGVAVGERS